MTKTKPRYEQESLAFMENVGATAVMTSVLSGSKGDGCCLSMYGPDDERAAAELRLKFASLLDFMAAILRKDSAAVLGDGDGVSRTH